MQGGGEDGGVVIYGSVCSGIEAATAAWGPLGWRAAWYSEIEPFPCAVLAHHYPGTRNLGDMTQFKEWPDGTIDLLVGGTPCQSFSVAGLRKGLDDPRGNLMLTYLAVARRYRPAWVVWENVPGVLSIDKGRAFGTFLGGLAELGYGFAYRVLDAQYFGVPQRRRRGFVVGHLGDWRRAAAVLFERHCLQGHPAPGRKAGERVAASFTASARGCNNENRAGAFVECVSSLTATGVGTCGADDNQAQAGHLIPDTFGGNNMKGPMLIPVPILEIGKGTTSRGAGPNGCGIGKESDPMFTLQANAQHAVAFKFGQGSKARSLGLREEQSPTLGSAESGTQLSPAVLLNAAVRRLTPRECERLQGFEDDFTLIPWRGRAPEECPDGPRYRALGNSMAVPVMRWIGERIDMIEREDYLGINKRL